MPCSCYAPCGCYAMSTTSTHIIFKHILQHSCTFLKHFYHFYCYTNSSSFTIHKSPINDCQQTQLVHAPSAVLFASSPSSLSSFTSTNFHWLADTGATSHMTPHHHWIRNYSPLQIPNNSIVYLSWVGSVVFNPIIDGKATQTVEFSRILHIPSLQNNLLACLFLTKHKDLKIHIDSHNMDFIHHGQLLFCAPIEPNNCALVPLNHFLSLQTGHPHFLLHTLSGTVAVVTTILQTPPRCTRKIW